MDKVRKETIINEILFWKENNLLPSTYCDYLLAFYTEGEHEDIPVKKQRNRRVLLLLAATICLPIITILATYFTELSFDLQMLLTGIFVIISFFFVYFVLKIDKVYIHLPLIVASVLLFIFSIQLVEGIVGRNTVLLTCAIVINCLLWAGMGYYFKLKYFFISSGMGLFIVGVFWVM